MTAATGKIVVYEKSGGRRANGPAHGTEGIASMQGQPSQSAGTPRASKSCEQCGATFTKPCGYSAKQWTDRRTCGRGCASLLTARERKARRIGVCEDCGMTAPLRHGVRCESCHAAWRWVNDPAYRAAKQARNRAWLRANGDYYNERARAESEKHEARVKVGYAIRTGRIERDPCEACGTTERVEAHHDDYSRPFDVRWLCTSCHAAEHRMARRSAEDVTGGGGRVGS